MEDLWKQRREPTPYRIDDLTSIPESSVELPLNSLWSLEKWISEFASTIQILAGRFEEESNNGRVLSWDKVLLTMITEISQIFRTMTLLCVLLLRALTSVHISFTFRPRACLMSNQWLAICEFQTSDAVLVNLLQHSRDCNFERCRRRSDGC